MSARLLIFVCLATSAQAGTWYVNGAAGAGGNGQTWGTAYQHVQDALAVAQPSDQVWVAQGTYLPGDATSARSVSFQIPSNVALYGGFAGGETLLAQRDWVAHETILSGDLHQDDLPGFVNRADNCYHVVQISAAGLSTGFDGFTVRAGNADGAGTAGSGGGMMVSGTTGSGPTFAHLRFVDNSALVNGGGVAVVGNLNFADSLFEHNHAGAGGGIYADDSGIDLVRCVLRSNDATGTGGACALGDFGGATFSNCLITGNSALYAGGVYVTYGHATLRSCTLAANHATSYGALAFSGFGLTDVFDSILWGNTDTTHPGAYEQQLNDGNTSLSFCAIQGSAAPWNLDPLFVNALGPDGIAGTADDDLRLSCMSPYIDAGSNSMAASGTTDFAGNARFLDDPATPDTGVGSAPIVDLGAYEFVCGCDDVQRYCSSVPNSTGVAATIDWSGSTSVFANSLTLMASGAPALKTGLFFYGSQQANVPWGDGLRCVGGSLQRLALVQTSAAGTATLPLAFGLPPIGSGPHAALPGTTWNFQFRFRDPTGGPNGWNSSDALEIHFCR